MNRTLTYLALGSVAAVLTIVMGLPIVFLVVLGAGQAAASPCLPGVAPTIPDLDAEQSTNAAIIVATARQEFAHLGRRAAVIAVATAMQESSLRNLDHGDDAGPDSRGLFQQRALSYPDTNRLDPADATRAFLRRLETIPDWEIRQPTSDVIHDVQVFADTERHRRLYDEKEPAAQGVVDELWPPDAPDAQAGTGAAVPPVCTGGGPRYTGPIVDGGYALPLDPALFADDPGLLA